MSRKSILVLLLACVMTAALSACGRGAPEGTNRSILFLVKDAAVVQIQMADGLDGQLWSPMWLGLPADKA